MTTKLLKKSEPKPPRHLLSGGKRLWIDISGEYALEPHQFELLRSLCECLDRQELCRRQLKKDGLFSENRFGEVKPHPALREEREHRILYARLIRELNLDLEIPENPRKPRRY
jgi:phage terminase small subunit